MRLVGEIGHGFLETVTIRRVGIDDHAHVRYLHTKSMTAQSADSLTDAEAIAFVAFVRSPAYSDSLMTEDVYGAFVDGQLIGTASWHVTSDDGRLARISSVFVDPLFVRIGIGRRLLAEVEARAYQSGFDQFGVSAPVNAVPFFERLGYLVASRGVKTFGPECALPVAFLRKSVPRMTRAAQAPAT